jgi:hypothetical protein
MASDTLRFDPAGCYAFQAWTSVHALIAAANFLWTATTSGGGRRKAAVISLQPAAYACGSRRRKPGSGSSSSGPATSSGLRRPALTSTSRQLLEVGRPSRTLRKSLSGSWSISAGSPGSPRSWSSSTGTHPRGRVPETSCWRLCAVWSRRTSSRAVLRSRSTCGPTKSLRRN